MQQTSDHQSKDFISNFTFKELLNQVEFDLRIKEFVVMNIDKSNHNVKLNTPYRSDYFTIFLIQKGSIRFRLDNTSYQVDEGDVVFCPMAETFLIEHTSEDYNAKYIFFSLAFISDAGINYKSNNVLKSLSSDPANIIKNEPNLYRRINFHLDELRILNNTEKENYYFNELIWHHFSLVIYEIDNYFKKIEKIHHITSREDEITTNFFILVRENFKERHNVQFYADSLFISRKYLTKVISKTMQRSPKDIIHQVLVIEAKILLRDSTANVGEVATQMNFPDTASFSKFFKKLVGQSPLKYKGNDLF